MALFLPSGVFEAEIPQLLIRTVSFYQRRQSGVKLKDHYRHLWNTRVITGRAIRKTAYVSSSQFSGWSGIVEHLCCRTFLFYISQGFKLHEPARMLNIAEAKIRSDSVRCRRKTIHTLCSDAKLKDDFNAVHHAILAKLMDFYSSE